MTMPHLPSTEPLFSVVMPTYNGEKYLPRALESLLQQNDPSMEVIAVDDGSSDQTVEILKSYEGRLNIKVVLRPHQGNWVVSTNEGLRQAQGRYVGFLHQDDFWLPHRLSRLREVMSAHPALPVYLHAVRFVDEHECSLGLWRCPLPDRSPVPPSTWFPRLLVQNFIAIPAPIFVRALFERMGPLKEELTYTADWAFWLRLATENSACYLNEPLAAFRIHSASQTVQQIQRHTDYVRQMRMVWQDFRGRLEGGKRSRSYDVAAEFSVEANAVLAASAARCAYSKTPLIRLGLRLGPVGWWRYWVCSRVAERVGARLRARLVPRLAMQRTFY
jgi:glycosyltransferase involved in cell wall biosynthesis